MKWLMLALGLMLGGVAGWVYRDHTIPQPSVTVVRDTVQVIVERITQGQTIIRENLDSANAERDRRVVAEGRLDSLVASLGDTATWPQPMKALVQSCNALRVACVAEAGDLRLAVAVADSTLEAARVGLQSVRDSLEQLRRATPRCAGSTFSRTRQGATLGMLLGAGTGLAVGLFTPEVSALETTFGGLAGGLVGGAVTGLTIKCSAT